MNAAARRAEREYEREQRRLHKQAIIEAKEQLIQANADLVDHTEAATDIIINPQKGYCDAFDWEDLFEAPEPTFSDPALKAPAANKALSNYHPSVWDLIFFRRASKEALLQQRLEAAQREDAVAIANHEAKKKEAIENWQQGKSIAASVLKGDFDQYAPAMEFTGRLQAAKLLGRYISMNFPAKNFGEVTFYASDISLIPSQTFKMLKNGDVSSKELSDGKRNEMHRQYVCGTALRIAMEILSTIPVDFVIVNISCEVLNQSTGYMEESIVLSQCIPWETLTKLDTDNISTVHALQNFVHRIKFTKAGLEPVEPLNAEQFAR